MINNLKKIIYFGEKVNKFSVRVLNEREIRAAAGILFLFAFIAFFQAWFLQNFLFLKIFIMAFFLDFFIRIIINPRFSPSLILGRLIVHDQKPEYSGAPQKKFAWSIGLFLSTIMLFSIFIGGTITPINLIICIICLIFLFSESVFGICAGCKIYNKLHKEHAQLCPGGICEENKIKEEIQKTNKIQISILLLFIIAIIIISFTNVFQELEVRCDLKEMHQCNASVR